MVELIWFIDLNKTNLNCKSLKELSSSPLLIRLISCGHTHIRKKSKHMNDSDHTR